MPALSTLAPLLVVGVYGSGLVLERVLPARALPRVDGWWQRSLIMFVPTVLIAAVVPALVAEHFGALAPLHLQGLGTWVGGAVALACTDFGGYWLHRLQHRSATLWRCTHQMHHAAERVDVLGAAYFHPLDTALGALVSSVCAAVLGVSANAVALTGVVTLLMAILQHLNVRTPVWLGYVVQRPEAHSVHHARGVHAYNYGNLALWDLAFGTFRNPREFAAESGFYPGASARVADLLRGRNLQRPDANEHEPP
jgi:sterol desaturase/sphingolipid hydroxylase (fatty acid hydroxylase superfamily)